MQLDVKTIAGALSGTVAGDGDTVIAGVAGVDTAEVGDLVFAEAPKYLQAAVRSRASAVLVTPELAAMAAAAGATKSLVVVDQPRVAFVQVLGMFAPPAETSAGVHESARVGERARLGQGVHIGANAVVGDDVELGDGVSVLAGV